MSIPFKPAPAASSPAYAAERLGTEPIVALLFRFSVPAITGMVVNALYNIVDRAFVGRGVSALALGGLALVMPLMTIMGAFAMLFGVGAANMISVRLGEGRKDEAENALNHCFLLLVLSGVVMTTVCLPSLDFLVSLLGAQEGSESLEYTREYFRIILIGAVFSTVGFGFSHCTRAQGFPKITMVGMLIGAATNALLDPLFIFVFHWGVKGAALATIISQCASSMWILSFSFSPKALIRLRLRTFKPSLKIVTQIVSFGSAQFLLQVVMSGVQLLYNTSMSRYGVESLGVPNGGDIALSGMNIQGSVMFLFLMPVFGINQGAQPILGYNYGARQFKRVKKTYLYAVAAATSVCLVGFILAEAFPGSLVSIFAPDGDPKLVSFAIWTIRVALILLPVVGFQVVSSNVFVVTGRPKTAIFLSMLRQCVLLIPCILLFGRLWKLKGIVAAAPVADACSSVFTAVLIYFEMKKLSRKT